MLCLLTFQKPAVHVKRCKGQKGSQDEVKIGLVAPVPFPPEHGRHDHVGNEQGPVDVADIDVGLPDAGPVFERHAEGKQQQVGDPFCLGQDAKCF